MVDCRPGAGAPPLELSHPQPNGGAPNENHHNQVSAIVLAMCDTLMTLKGHATARPYHCKRSDSFIGIELYTYFA